MTLLGALLFGCPSPESPESKDTTPGIVDSTPPDPPDTADTTPLTGDPADLTLQPAQTLDNGRFATNQVCADCHDGASGTMEDSAGRNISPVDLWQSSMMANAGRDPLWRAQMSAEIAATPTAEEAIGQKCTRCHAPMASGDADLTGTARPTADVLTAGTDATTLALDGVSCTVCHQIEDIDLGAEASFGGEWTIAGVGRMYGPHPNPFDHPMSMQGFTPLQAAHIVESELCATCHTLTTHALAADGVLTGGTVLEQGPFLEWQNSSYANTDSCQDCHLPDTSVDGVPITTYIAHNPMGMAFPPTSPRSPYARHILVGANTLIPAILRDWASTLNPQAPAAAFDATIAAARDQLAQRTATVTIEAEGLVGDTLSFDARVVSQTGHKLPSGIPLRRVWLHTIVSDADDTVVFESGGWDNAGRLVDGQGLVLPSEATGGPILPHSDLISVSDQVAVYEGILADAAGDATFLLMRGEGWVKDNRLLPTGWDPAVAAANASSAVGVTGDPDFVGGGDTVHYLVDVASGTAPFTVEVEVVHQTLSARWASELFASGTAEALGFQVMYEAADRGPEPVAEDSASIP